MHFAKEPIAVFTNEPSRAGRCSAGFTLLEVLVASVLLSIVMASIYTFFHSAISTWRAVENDFNSFREGRIAYTLFSREVSNVFGPAALLDQGKEREVTLFVIGEPMDVEEENGARLMRVRYYLEGSGARRRLVREERQVQASLPEGVPTSEDEERQRIKLGPEHEFTIAENVRDFRLTYIWCPTPDDWDRKQPPPPMPPVPVKEHRRGWGLPQAIAFELTVFDPKEPEKEQTFSSTASIRASDRRLTKSELEKLLETSS